MYFLLRAAKNTFLSRLQLGNTISLVVLCFHRRRHAGASTECLSHAILQRKHEKLSAAC